MTERPQERIIVGVDDSPGGLAALRWAVHRARTDRSPLVAVRAWALHLPRHGGHRLRDDGHRHVVATFEGNVQREEAIAIIRRCFRMVWGEIPADVAVRVETPEGDPGTLLTGLARQEGDLLVVGRRHGHPAGRAVHGSVSSYCAGNARCPVLVIPMDFHLRE
jgi:nucleotide-binding universal stress UspA family protein